MSDVKLHIGRPAAWVEVTGEDCFNFLQGQFTNDLRSPAPTPITYGLWLDRKGKVIADSFVLQQAADRCYLYSYYSPAATIIERLEPFIIADDVTLRDLTDNATSASLWGERIDDTLIQAGFDRPDHGCFYHRDRLFLFGGRRSRKKNFELVVTGDDNEKTMALLTAGVMKAGGELVDELSMERERIAAGIPSIPRDVGPADLPQEGGLEHDAISYTKGCYLGQEVMARIRSMGQVRRILVQVQLNGLDSPPPALLYDGTREVGTLRSLTEPSPMVGLALVRREILDQRRELSLAPDAAPSVQIVCASQT